jgi:cyanophycin synthetase
MSVMTTKPQSSVEVLRREAQNRGISCSGQSEFRMGHLEMSYLDHNEITLGSRTQLLSSVASFVISNKNITNSYLKKWGFPLPKSIETRDFETASDFLDKQKLVVLKPNSTYGGVGITVGVNTAEMLNAAWDKAIKASPKKGGIVLQKHIKGKHYRVLVVNYDSVFVVERIPGHVVGDGISSIKQLIQSTNKLNDEKNSHLKISPEMIELLSESDYTLETVVPNKTFVVLHKLANVSQGGTCVDKTDEICESAKLLAIEVAKKFECPVLGLDCISKNISKSLGYINELNSSPGIDIHYQPAVGKSRNVAAKIIDMLFPETVGLGTI